MKNFLIVFFSLLPLLCWGSQRTLTVSLHYGADDFEILQIDGKTHIKSNIHNLVFEECETIPALPLIPVRVLISPNEHLDGYTFSLSDSTLWTGIDIAPCELPVTTDGTQSYANITSSGIEFTGLFPPNVSCAGLSVIDGYCILIFNVCPFSYDANSNSLSLNQSLTLSLTLSSSAQHAPSPIHNNIGSDGLCSFVESIVVNPEDMTNNYGNPIAAQWSGGPYDYYPYLLVTNETCKSAFEPLIEWKTIKGIRAKLLTVEEIESLYPGATMPLRIKNALNDYKNHHGTKYVLLGGDENIVPGQRCYIEANATKPNGEPILLQDTIVSDYFYSNLNSINWDTNGDGIAAQLYPENGGDSLINDFSHSLIVTRLPAMGIDSAITMANRIIEYEKAPVLDKRWDKVLLAGSILTSMDTIDGRPRSDVEKRSDIIISKISDSNWNCDIKKFFDTYTDFSGGANYNLTGSHLKTQLNTGYNLIHMDTHGAEVQWSLESGTFTRTPSRQLNTDAYSIILTTACSTNAFDRDYECLSQAFMQNKNSGVLGYWGSSRQGFVSSSFETDTIFIKNLLQDPWHRFGLAAVASKDALFAKKSHLLNQYSSTRWLMFALNPVSDPETPFFISRPKLFQNTSFSFRNNVLTVKADVQDFMVCVMSLGDCGNSFYLVSPSHNGRASFLGVPDSCSVCITAAGYVPFVKTIYKNVYLQNETISSDRMVVAEHTFAGSHVTNQMAHGPLVVDDGLLEIQSAGGVTLAPGFEVKRGASLSIKTSQ